jgi:GT2 family glycosyltransferase
MLDLTVSIVTADNRELILDCLRSIYASAEGLTMEVYVVINASRDDSEQALRERYPDVKLIVNETKLGFTHNHNMVMRRAQGRCILVLNDDTVILDGAMKGMVEVMDSMPRAGIVGCRILNADGSPQWSHGKSFSNRFEYFRSGMLRWLMPILADKHCEGTEEVDWVTGACMLIRAEAVREVGGFDENIVIYYEDGDLCYRMIKAGWKVIFNPAGRIIHYHGQTRKKHLGRDTLIIYQSRLYFFKKHYSRFVLSLVRALTAAEVALRSLNTWLFCRGSEEKRERRRDLLRAYARVFRLAVNTRSLPDP